MRKAKAKMLAELARLGERDKADLEWGVRLAEERDKRYSERDSANKDAVKAALAAVEKGSEKTEIALKEYKTGANEWRQTVTDLTSRMPSNVEVERRFSEIGGKIYDLRESRTKSEGQTAGLTMGWKILIGAVGFVSVLLGILVSGIGLYLALRGH